MGKYNSMSRREAPKKEAVGLPPIWRGIGFAMMILIPGMAYVGMLVLMQYNQDHNLFPIPMDIINKTVGGDPLLFVKIAVILVIMLVLYMILMMFTFVLNKIFVPDTLGPFDVPRVAYKRKKQH
jgi:hypothetical protein